MTPIVLIVNWVARRGHEEAVERVLLAMIELSREEPGCIRYDVYRSAVDKRCFLLVEIYRDQTGLEAHTASEHFKHHVLGEAVPLLDSRDRRQFEILGQHKVG
jgi:quinol monooxygenase YgiN